VSAEFDHICTTRASGQSGEDHQHDDVTKYMADIAPAGPAEIGYGESKVHEPFQNASLGDIGMGGFVLL